MILSKTALWRFLKEFNVIVRLPVSGVAVIATGEVDVPNLYVDSIGYDHFKVSFLPDV